MFFIPKTSVSNIEFCSVGNIISDHAPIFIGLRNLNLECRSRPWRYNSFLNHDPNFEKYLKEQLNYFFKENKTPGVSPSLIWDTAKACTRCLIISYTARLKKNSRMKQRQLELHLHELQKKYDSCPSEKIRDELHTVKTALDVLLTKKAEKSIFFARQRLYDFANKPNCYLANLL